jgi:hypothetical protein
LWTWAEVASLEPNYAMAKWKMGEKEWRKEEWESSLKKARMAHRLNPINADFVSDLAALYEWRALQYPVWDKTSRENRSQSIGFYEQAITMRPSWGLNWASLAQGRLYNQQLDQETTTALDKAIILGAWEPIVQEKVMLVGMSAWKYLNSDVRQNIQLTINRALERPERENKVIEIAVATGWERYLKSMLFTYAQHLKLGNALDRKQVQSK